MEEKYTLVAQVVCFQMPWIWEVSFYSHTCSLSHFKTSCFIFRRRRASSWNLFVRTRTREQKSGDELSKPTWSMWVEWVLSETQTTSSNNKMAFIESFSMPPKQIKRIDSFWFFFHFHSFIFIKKTTGSTKLNKVALQVCRFSTNLQLSVNS